MQVLDIKEKSAIVPNDLSTAKTCPKSKYKHLHEGRELSHKVGQLKLRSPDGKKVLTERC